jgi:hypothetical protein
MGRKLRFKIVIEFCNSVRMVHPAGLDLAILVDVKVAGGCYGIQDSPR